ncbi:hypothetical protein KEJ37_05625 [Candidatus Bathyarchaeota archaeon]|nr:hypothetical protein [Candidatus Bathyarchaeota archaeon]
MDNMHNQFFPRAVAEGWLGVNYYTRFVIKGRETCWLTVCWNSAVPKIVPNYGFGC